MKPAKWLGWFGVSTLVLAGAGMAPAGQAAAAPVTEEFGCTGSPVQWTVPTEVTEATFEVYGAQGGAQPGGAAGKGGSVSAVVDVTAGETMQIVVGCQGQGGRNGGSGGFNGGGNGGWGDATNGGGGGGASDVRRDGGGLGARILVAGGGGGGAVGSAGGSGGNPGGDGEGGDGPGGGGGATVDAPGGGAGAGFGGQAGEPGAVGVGGNGASMNGTEAAGAGGGGFYGGGGGASGVGGPGAGGGGSSFAGDGIDATFQTGVREGDGLITITYEDPNAAPVPVDDEATTIAGESVSFNVLGNDSDPDGDPLAIDDITQPDNGSVDCVDDGTCTYTPNDGFTGDDGFIYTVTDGAATAQATVTIAVAPPPNQAPAPADDEVTTTAEESVSFNVLDNDSDPDGDSLTMSNTTQPTSGSVDCADDGSCTYTPNDGFTGDDGFTYTVTDGAATANATVAIVVSAPPNQAPAPVDDEVTATAGESVSFNVLDNDSDPDGDSLTMSNTTQPDNGSVDCADDGSCTYTPNDGFTGDDGFTYTVTDGVDDGVGTTAVAEASVAIVVSPAPTTTTSPPSSTAAPTTTAASPSTTAAVVVPTTPTTTTPTTTTPSTLPETGGSQFGPMLTIALLILTAGGGLLVFTARGHIPRNRTHNSG